MYYGNQGLMQNNPYGNIQQQVIKPAISIYHVNNKQEAENWMVEPGQTVYLFDNTNNRFYIKSVNNNGMINPLEVYVFSKETTQEENASPEYVTREEFENLKEIINEHFKPDPNVEK